MQSLEAGVVRLQRRGEAVLGDQEVNEQIDPLRQRGVRCAAARQEGRPGIGAGTVIRRLWTETEPFDFDGTYLHLTGAFCNPKPVQRPHPPVLIGGCSTATLRVVAEHADLWNIPGGDIDDAVRRGAMLDRFCAEIGRDPASVGRSIVLPVSYDHPVNTRDAIAEAIAAGFRHVVLGLPAPYPDHAARWVTSELISEFSPAASSGSPT